MNLIEKIFQDEFGMVLRCKISIELNWVEKYGKSAEKPTFWEKFEHMYQYKLEVYRYM